MRVNTVDRSRSAVDLNNHMSLFTIAVYLCRTFAEPGEKQEALLLCPETRRFAIFSLQFSQDGREILGGANDGYIYVYDLECNQRALRVSL